MKLKKITMALPAVVMISLGMLISACGDTPAAGTASGTQDAAKQQFLADRGGTPGVTTSGTPGAGGTGTGFNGNRAPGVIGSVEKVDGNKITVKSMQDGTETVVQLGDSAKVTKEITGTLSDLKTGDTVTATGTKTGDTVAATSVRIGTGGFGGFGGRGAGGFGGRGANASGTPFAGTGANASGTPFAGNGANASGTSRAGFGGNGANASGTPGVGRDFATGTVQKIDGNTITIQATDGTTSTFMVSADTTFQESVDIQASDLKAGDMIFATGTQNGDVFDATAVQLVTNLGQFPGGGQGGPGALPGQQPGATTP